MSTAAVKDEERKAAMKVTYNYPRGANTKFSYGPNHHYVDLEDEHGNKSHLPATDLMRCQCTSCKMVFWVHSNLGEMRCPHCMGVAKKVWGQLQIAFVPEAESEFKPPEQLTTGDLEVEEEEDPEREGVEDSELGEEEVGDYYDEDEEGDDEDASDDREE
jgi:hypothetical protein